MLQSSLGGHVPRVSVVVPAYNAMPYLPETLDSVLAQSLRDMEVIVVDNGSSDGTRPDVNQLRDPRLRLLRLPENKGISGGCNAGLAAATGTYVAPMEADDLWHVDKLARLVALLDADPQAVLAYSFVELIDQDGRRSGNVVGRRVEGDVRAALLEDVVVPCGSSPVVRRQQLVQIGGWDESLRSSPDWDLYLRLARTGTFRVLPEPLVGYRQHRTNTSLDWATTSRDLERILQRAYADASDVDGSDARRVRTTARMTLYFGWKSLQAGDHRQALELRDRSVQLDPTLRGTREHRRLTAHASALRLLGRHGYEQGLTALRGARRRVIDARGGRR